MTELREELYCIGCGAKIQTENKDELGYTPQSALEKGIENLERERIARQAEAERDKADAQAETKKDAAPAQEKEPKKDTLNFITDNASYNPVGEWRQGL